ncbi:MAG: hypothetical protein NBV57_06620, partial [Algoriphagus sp.]|nr:hypothetical protein [Algoriphagus sp.]
MKQLIGSILIPFSVLACAPRTGHDLKPLFEAVLLSDLAKERPVWVIAESDSAANRKMFGMEICSAEFFRRSLQGKNRMVLGDREAKLTIWDCAGTCLMESKVYRFTPEDFPEGVEFISQRYYDSLVSVTNFLETSDSPRFPAYLMISEKGIYKFSKPIFFGGGDFAFLNYSNSAKNAGYLV